MPNWRDVECGAESQRRAHAIRVADEFTAGLGARPDTYPAGGAVPLHGYSGHPAVRGHLVIATDLDGTLLRTDGTLSARTATVLDEVARLGHEVVFVTGRAVRDMDRIGELTGHRGRTICANGAATYDHRERRVTRTRPLALGSLISAVNCLAHSISDIIIAVESVDGFIFLSGYPFPQGRDINYPVMTVDQLAGVDVLQLLAWHRTLREGEVARSLLGVANESVEVTCGNTRGVAEVSARGVDKGSAVASLISAMGLTKDSVVAFGDMPNDLPLLSWAGVAYAMANAHPQVLATVRRRAPRNDSDGVALTLEQLLDLRITQHRACPGFA